MFLYDLFLEEYKESHSGGDKLVTNWGIDILTLDLDDTEDVDSLLIDAETQKRYKGHYK